MNDLSFGSPFWSPVGPLFAKKIESPFLIFWVPFLDGHSGGGGRFLGGMMKISGEEGRFQGKLFRWLVGRFQGGMVKISGGEGKISGGEEEDFRGEGKISGREGEDFRGG